MSFRVVKPLNNNAVLVQRRDGSQIVLMSKGVGFGKKRGDDIEETEGQKTFYILDSGKNESKLRQMSFEEESVEKVTREIVALAERRLNLSNEKLYNALLDHITFAIECLQMGLPIDNPFLGEIAILYREEYETAQIAAGIIRDRLSVEIGEDETGFIALHLYSARQRKHIRSAMKSTRVFREILTMLSGHYGETFDVSSPSVTSFLLSLSQMIEHAEEGRSLVMKIRDQVRYGIDSEWKMAKEIVKLIQKELGVTLSEDGVAFLAVNLYQLIQL